MQQLLTSKVQFDGSTIKPINLRSSTVGIGALLYRPSQKSRSILASDMDGFLGPKAAHPYCLTHRQHHNNLCVAAPLFNFQHSYKGYLY